jgi:hypothetical protein
MDVWAAAAAGHDQKIGTTAEFLTFLQQIREEWPATQGGAADVYAPGRFLQRPDGRQASTVSHLQSAAARSSVNFMRRRSARWLIDRDDALASRRLEEIPR